jgi:hypothetical protein
MLVRYNTILIGSLTMKTIRLTNETSEFLEWLVRQDVTLPSVITDYLRWDKYSKEQITAHFRALYNACIESHEDKSDLRKKQRT